MSSISPSVGMLATVRNRRGIVSAVEPFEGHEDGVLHLVTMEYTDNEGVLEDQLAWEREPGARLVPQRSSQQPDAPGICGHTGQMKVRNSLTIWT